MIPHNLCATKPIVEGLMYINKETFKRTPEPVKSSDRHRTPTIDPGRLFLSQTIHLCPEMHLFRSLGLGDTW